MDNTGNSSWYLRISSNGDPGEAICDILVLVYGGHLVHLFRTVNFRWRCIIYLSAFEVYKISLDSYQQIYKLLPRLLSNNPNSANLCQMPNNNNSDSLCLPILARQLCTRISRLTINCYNQIVSQKFETWTRILERRFDV